MSQNSTLNNALPAETAYKSLPGNGNITVENLDFSVPLANDFIEAFSFINQSLQNDYPSGFQGTVFQNKTSDVIRLPWPEQISYLIPI